MFILQSIEVDIRVLDRSHRHAMAFLALFKILEESSYSNITLQQLFKHAKLSKSDRRFVTAAVYGVCSRLLSIEAYLSTRVLKKSLNKLDAVIRVILIYGTWLLIYSKQQKPYAIVNELCHLAHRLSHLGGVGFLNATLRAVAADISQMDKMIHIQQGTGDDRSKERMALIFAGRKKRHLLYGFSPELFGLFKKWFPNDYETVIQAFDRRQDTIIRYRLQQHLSKNDALDDPMLSPACLMPNAYRVDAGLDPERFLQKIEAGEWIVQGEASMLPAYILDVQQGERVLDVCAAPGGKTLQLADACGSSGSVIATDLHAHRVALIQSLAERCGVKHITALERDGTKPLPIEWQSAFDYVLCDVPCSGLGQLGARPELRYKMTYETIQDMPQLQRKLLDNHARAVRVGGLLAYSTCTLNPAENQQLIFDWLQSLDAKSDVEFERVSLVERVPTKLIEDPSALLEAQAGYLTVRPDRDGCDGFFVALLRRVR